MRRCVIAILLLLFVWTAQAQPRMESSLGTYPLPKVVGMSHRVKRPRHRKAIVRPHVAVPNVVANVYDDDLDLPVLKLSEEGEAFIKKIEGFRPTPYRDANGWAVGYGMHTWDGERVTKHSPAYVTQEEADEEFAAQIEDFEAVVAVQMNEMHLILPQHAFDALVSVAYNLGRINTRILDKLEVRAPVSPRDFLSTATVNRRPYYALQVRRLQEFSLFAGGL